MSPVDREIVRRKLAVIMESLDLLEPIQGMSKEEYIADIYKRKAAERLLQELIEAAIDLNTYLLVQTGRPVPSDYFESFMKAGEYHILPPELAEKLAPSAGLRSRLVHEYDLLEHTLVLEAVRRAEEFYPRYISRIESFIEK